MKEMLQHRIWFALSIQIYGQRSTRITQLKWASSKLLFHSMSNHCKNSADIHDKAGQTYWECTKTQEYTLSFLTSVAKKNGKSQIGTQNTHNESFMRDVWRHNLLENGLQILHCLPLKVRCPAKLSKHFKITVKCFWQFWREGMKENPAWALTVVRSRIRGRQKSVSMIKWLLQSNS